ncbi:MAG: histidine triad nucleotide-binding protein [Christensenellales bacterium]
MDCLFCKIISGEIPSKKVYEDENVFAFEDIDPRAPVHALVIPKEHMKSLDDTAGKEQTVSAVMAAVPKIAKQLGLENGYRTVINTGADGNQTVWHLHVHILGGRLMGWPPG